MAARLGAYVLNNLASSRRRQVSRLSNIGVGSGANIKARGGSNYGPKISGMRVVTVTIALVSRLSRLGSRQVKVHVIVIMYIIMFIITFMVRPVGNRPVGHLDNKARRPASWH